MNGKNKKNMSKRKEVGSKEIDESDVLSPYSSKKTKSVSSLLSSLATSLATMPSSLTTMACIYIRGSVTDDAFDTHTQLLNQEVLKAGFAVGMTISEVRSAFKGKRSSNNFEDMELIQFLNNPNGIHHLFIVSEDRLARNTVLAGTVIALCKQHNITIHIVGVESPYKFVPTTGEGEQRLWLALLDAVKESEEKSKRAIRSAQHRAILRLSSPPRPYEPPFVSDDMLKLLKFMINGCTINEFNDAFNKMLSKNPDQNDRIGGDWIFADDYGFEMSVIEKNTINLTRMLTTFNIWNLYRENKTGKMLKTKWTSATLSEVISHHFGQKVLEKINKKWDQFFDDDDNEEMEDAPIATAEAAAKPAVSDRIPHADILGHRDVLCDECQATILRIGQKFCHDCGTQLRKE